MDLLFGSGQGSGLAGEQSRPNDLQPVLAAESTSSQVHEQFREGGDVPMLLT